MIAIGAGVALLCIKLARREMPAQVLVLVAAAGSFAALSFIFDSPLIAAVILIEGDQESAARGCPCFCFPGLLAAGIGTLVSIGMGSFTGLSNSAYALGPLSLPHFAHPTIGQFGWTILLAILIAAGTRAIMVGGLGTYGVVARRLLLFLPVVGLIIAGLAIAFHGATGKNVNEVLFSGQDALPGLVEQAGTWSVGALLLLILIKGIAYSLSLGSFRGGPTFPARGSFLGAAAGVAASHLPGFSLAPAIGVGIGAGTVGVLRLPLSAIVLATLLTVKSGTGDEPLIIVGVVVAYLVTVLLSPKPSESGAPASSEQTAKPARPAAAAAPTAPG